jgi:RNA 2',3'-cyclic 3'-phosphodiesterase
MQTSNVRLFLAVWPDARSAVAASALAQAVATASEGRAVPSANIHLTLAFLGRQAAASVDRIERSLEKVDGTGFELTLDQLGFWRKAGIVWLGATTVPPAILGLNRSLVAALSNIGIATDDRPYHPHVTLARKAATYVTRVLRAPIVWRADAFSLVASEPGRTASSYRRLAAWPLRPHDE